MLMRNTSDRYGLISQSLHWLVVLLVFVQFIIGVIAADLPLGMQRLMLLARHKSIGMTILMLVVLRILWRLSNIVPKLPAQLPVYQQRLAYSTHWLLYGLLVCMPIAGWIHSSASNLTVSWFGLFTWPDLVEPDKQIAAIAKGTHEILGRILFVVVGLHFIAAVRHHFILKDDVLRRMLPQFNTKQNNDDKR